MQHGHLRSYTIRLRFLQAFKCKQLTHSRSLCPSRQFSAFLMRNYGGGCWCGCAAGGRFLNDTWQLDLATLEWKSPPLSSATRSAETLPPSSSGPQSSGPSPPPPAGNPPIAGHTLIPWQGSLISIGGHIKVPQCSLAPHICLHDRSAAIGHQPIFLHSLAPSCTRLKH